MTLTGIFFSVLLGLVPFKDCNYAICQEALPCKVEIDCGATVTEADLSPHSRGVKTEINGSRVSFVIEHYGQYQLKADGKRYFIFAEKPGSTVEGKSILSFGKMDRTGAKDMTALIQKAINKCAHAGETLVFPEGTYLCRQLTLPDNTHIHLEKGATLKAKAASYKDFIADDGISTKRFINIRNASNVKVTGLGAIDGSGAELRSSFADNARMRLILAAGSKDILFEGVMLMDPGSWNTQILLCQNVVFRNVKILNDFDISNTDGFDPDSSCNVLLENSFAYCSDDNVAIKTTGYSGLLGDVSGVCIRGCVFITRKSALKIGTETKGMNMSDIVFEDNDVLEADRGMAIYVSDGAAVSDVTYRDNRFEGYSTKGKMTGFEFAVNKRKENSPAGSIRGLNIIDCLFEKPFPKNSVVKSVETGSIEATFKNLRVSGAPVTGRTANDMITIKNAKVTFE